MASFGIKDGATGLPVGVLTGIAVADPPRRLAWTPGEGTPSVGEESSKSQRFSSFFALLRFTSLVSEAVRECQLWTAAQFDADSPFSVGATITTDSLCLGT